MVKRLTTISRLLLGASVASSVAASGCGIDPRIWGNLTSSDYDTPPPAGVQTVTGVASLIGTGGTVAFFTPGGVALTTQSTTTTTDGAFTTTFPATAAFENTVVVSANAATATWGLVPRVPKKATVYDPSLTIAMGTDVPNAEGQAAAVTFMADLDEDATAATLLLLAKAHLSQPESTLASLTPEAVIDSLAEIQALFEDDDIRLTPVREMVARIVGGGITTRPALRPFPTTGQSYLDLAALKAGADYDGDGTADTSTAAFDEALERAMASLQFDVCYAPDTIRVVLVVDFREGGKDGNCNAINLWKWTIDAPDKHMFITGSLHASTPNCTADPAPCLENTVFDAASQQMGNWSPNTIPMYDDGTHGDKVAGDNLWTITFDLPWFDAGAPNARWVRIAYKYTWGSQGALWTGSEEWPGNQRILELRDINGDRIITRQDLYGDETSNKDKSNLRSPGNGGCGTVLWQSDLPKEGRNPNCVDDTLESQIDTDGDCTLDSWPSDFSAAPITVPCEE